MARERTQTGLAAAWGAYLNCLKMQSCVFILKSMAKQVKVFGCCSTLECFVGIQFKGSAPPR